LWLNEFTYDEIAKFLRISVDAVKSRLRDAKKFLRARLGDGNALPEDEE
jgi:DNA-directed RNA polymerase specialized sigma24 family protein